MVMLTNQIRPRYIVALTLIALVISASAGTLHYLIQSKKGDAALINKAGQQRMLSQRIALMVNQIQSPQLDPSYVKAYKQELKNITDLFINNHQFLTKSITDVDSKALLSKYFEGEQSLDDRVNSYAAHAYSMVNSRQQVSNNILQHFNHDITKKLLGDLNAVVLQFEKEANQRIAMIAKVEMGLWLLAMSLLICEFIFIFRPMEQLISENFKKIVRLSITDELTGLHNRRYMHSVLSKEYDRFKRYGDNFCVALIDVDYFKKLNDSYGHDVGDEALKLISFELKRNLRVSDHLCRWGGEEFIICLAHTDLSLAKNVCDRINREVRALVMTAHPDIKLAVSIGISSSLDGTEGIDSILKQADEALYTAKSTGRDKACIAPAIKVVENTQMA